MGIAKSTNSHTEEGSSATIPFRTQNTTRHKGRGCKCNPRLEVVLDLLGRAPSISAFDANYECCKSKYMMRRRTICGLYRNTDCTDLEECRLVGMSHQARLIRDGHTVSGLVAVFAYEFRLCYHLLQICTSASGQRKACIRTTVESQGSIESKNVLHL